MILFMSGGSHMRPSPGDLVHQEKTQHTIIYVVLVEQRLSLELTVSAVLQNKTRVTPELHTATNLPGLYFPLLLSSWLSVQPKSHLPRLLPADYVARSLFNRWA